MSRRILLFGCELLLCQRLGSCMERLRWIWRKAMSYVWRWRITITRIVLMARRSLCCQLLAGLVGRMTSLALLISLLEDWASFCRWRLPSYILSSQGKKMSLFLNGLSYFVTWIFTYWLDQKWCWMHSLFAHSSIFDFLLTNIVFISSPLINLIINCILLELITC